MKLLRIGLRSAAVTIVGGIGLGLVSIPAALAAPAPAATVSSAACQAYDKVALSFTNSPLFANLEKQFVKSGTQPTDAQIAAATKKAFATRAGYNLEKQIEKGYVSFYQTYGSQLPANLQGDVKDYISAGKQFEGLSYSKYKSLIGQVLTAQNFGGSASTVTDPSSLKNLPGWLRKDIAASVPLSTALASCVTSGLLTSTTT